VLFSVLRRGLLRTRLATLCQAQNASTTESDLALRGPRSPGSSLGASLATRTAVFFAVLLHHRTPNLLPCVDARVWD